MKIFSVIFLVSTFLGFYSFADGTVYVQAVKTALRESPQVSAKALVELPRGSELKVLETKDLWLKVNYQNKTGWVAKLTTNTYKPVGQAKLQTELQGTAEKSSRKRSSAYAVSASTRGLSESSRVRTGREEFKSDSSAVDKMEKLNIKEEDVEKFSDDAKTK